MDSNINENELILKDEMEKKLNMKLLQRLRLKKIVKIMLFLQIIHWIVMGV